MRLGHEWLETEPTDGLILLSQGNYSALSNCRGLKSPSTNEPSYGRVIEEDFRLEYGSFNAETSENSGSDLRP